MSGGPAYCKRRACDEVSGRARARAPASVGRMSWGLLLQLRLLQRCRAGAARALLGHFSRGRCGADRTPPRAPLADFSGALSAPVGRDSRAPLRCGSWAPLARHSVAVGAALWRLRADSGGARVLLAPPCRRSHTAVPRIGRIEGRSGRAGNWRGRWVPSRLGRAGASNFVHAELCQRRRLPLRCRFRSAFGRPLLRTWGPFVPPFWSSLDRTCMTGPRLGGPDYSEVGSHCMDLGSRLLLSTRRAGTNLDLALVGLPGSEDPDLLKVPSF